MSKIEVYPYENFKQKMNIIKEHKGRYSDLGNCLMYATYTDNYEMSVGKMCWQEKHNKINLNI